jgi:hypothetical protein
MTAQSLSARAAHLLAQLQIGTNVADPTPNIGAMAYSSLARAFFSNARSLCQDEGLSDFRVYGALYSLRHGLELMLKCIVRNDRIDAALRELSRPGQSFDAVCAKLALKKRGDKELLRQAICVMRNVLQDGITYPRCFDENVDPASAERALDYLRKNPNTPRDRFADVWTSGAIGHDLLVLWQESAPTVEDFAGNARRHAAEIGFAPPLTKDELEPIVELLAALDDGGDGFRYPSSISGAWYNAVPSLSLSAVGELVEKLEGTCVVFESVRDECYSMATVGRPTPQYSGY